MKMEHLGYQLRNKYIIKKCINLFTWNDLAIIGTSAPPIYQPGKIAVVCGMEQIKSEKLSKEFNLCIGDWLYTVEFEDGSSIDVPEIYLKKYDNNNFRDLFII